MKRIISTLVLVTLSLAGCGDDDDGGDGNTGGTGATNATGGTSQGEAGEDSTPVGGAPTGNVGCDPAEATTCQNEMDCPVVVDGTARMTAGVCGQGCLGEEESCAIDCITNEIDISPDCATCYAQTVQCSVENCLEECLADTESDECKLCQVQSGCREAFNTCSGLPE